MNNIKKNIPVCLLTFFLCLAFASAAHAVRIKDITSVKGIRSNQLVGYGLVVGLDGTGDKKNTLFTYQSLANLMEQMGIRIDKNQVKVKNVAAVMVTASLPPFARIGDRLDVTVSSVGDAKSISGGTLIVTPLQGVDGSVYALAQGAIALGGYGVGNDGGGATKNHLMVARIANGATVEQEIPFELNKKDSLTLSLRDPDFTTALRMSEAINTAVGKPVATAQDAGTIQLVVPSDQQGKVSHFLGQIENIEVTPDTKARIVVNEKTGTIVIGEKVRISTVAVSHGNLSITVNTTPVVSQPPALSGGETVVAEETTIEVEEEIRNLMVLPSNTTVGDLVDALNAIGVTPRDMISIFQSIKAAGALQADLVII